MTSAAPSCHDTWKLYSYWRSTAAYRVRLALNLKGIDVEVIPVHLVRSGGEQHNADYRAINPNSTVPSLALPDGTVMTQSLAIIRYLDAVKPDPRLIPSSPHKAALVESAAQQIACDIHPINNLRVTTHLKRQFDCDQKDIVAWMQHWMRSGLTAFQNLITKDDPYCFGTAPSLADICLVPQLYNARRWDVDLDQWQRLIDIETRCLHLNAFQRAAPELQSDAAVQSVSVNQAGC